MMGQRKRSNFLVAGVMLSALVHTAANAADAQQPVLIEPADEWRFSIAPYLWGAGLNGDAGLFGLQPINIDMSFGDIIDDLHFGGMLVAEAHNGTWGPFGDIVYDVVQHGPYLGAIFHF
jgi:hypothetical protein